MSEALAAARRAGKAGVLVSLAYLVLSLAAAYLGRLYLHMYGMMYGFLGLFVSSIAVAYVLGMLRDKRIARASTPIPLLFAVPYPLYAAAGEPIASAYAAIVEAYTVLVLAYAFSRARGSEKKLSLLLGVEAYALAALVSARLAETGAATGIPAFDVMLRLGIAYSLALPVTMIYAVTVLSLPTTYDDQPNIPAASVLAILHAVAVTAYTLTLAPALLAASSASLLVYIAAAKLYKLHSYIARAKAKWRGVPLKTHIYFLRGYILATLSAIVASAALAAAAASPSIPSEINTLHILNICFTGTHIYIHAPLMLPVILATATARRYNPAPYIALVLSCAAYPLHREASLALLALSAILLVLVVKPAKRKKKDWRR